MRSQQRPAVAGRPPPLPRLLPLLLLLLPGAAEAAQHRADLVRPVPVLRRPSPPSLSPRPTRWCHPPSFTELGGADRARGRVQVANIRSTQVNTVTYGAKNCQVTVIGWVCDPSELIRYDYASASKAQGDAAQETRTEECCTPACVQAKHELLKQEKDKLTSVHFYVDFHAGDDANNGTAADRPWRTLGRANFEVRLRRERAGDGLKLAEPVQVWVKDPSSFARPASWHGLTFDDSVQL